MRFIPAASLLSLVTAAIVATPASASLIGEGSGGGAGVFADTQQIIFTVTAPSTLTASLTLMGNSFGGETLSVLGKSPFDSTPITLGGNTDNLSYAGLMKGVTYDLSVLAAGLGGTYNYKASVSAVPLPAALPLFGASVASLVGLGWRRSRRSAKPVA